MGKLDVSIVVGILFVGFLAGVISSASIKIGQNLAIDSFLSNVFGSFCENVKNLPQSGEAYSACKMSFIILTLIITIFSFLGILLTASKTGNIIGGTLIYIVGWILGFLIIFLFI